MHTPGGEPAHVYDGGAVGALALGPTGHPSYVQELHSAEGDALAGRETQQEYGPDLLSSSGPAEANAEPPAGLGHRHHSLAGAGLEAGGPTVPHESSEPLSTWHAGHDPGPSPDTGNWDEGTPHGGGFGAHLGQGGAASSGVSESAPDPGDLHQRAASRGGPAGPGGGASLGVSESGESDAGEQQPASRRAQAGQGGGRAASSGASQYGLDEEDCLSQLGSLAPAKPPWHSNDSEAGRPAERSSEAQSSGRVYSELADAQSFREGSTSGLTGPRLGSAPAEDFTVSGGGLAFGEAGEVGAVAGSSSIDSESLALNPRHGGSVGSGSGEHGRSSHPASTDTDAYNLAMEAQVSSAEASHAELPALGQDQVADVDDALLLGRAGEAFKVRSGTGRRSGRGSHALPPRPPSRAEPLMTGYSLAEAPFRFEGSWADADQDPSNGAARPGAATPGYGHAELPHAQGSRDPGYTEQGPKIASAQRWDESGGWGAVENPKGSEQGLEPAGARLQRTHSAGHGGLRRARPQSASPHGRRSSAAPRTGPWSGAPQERAMPSASHPEQESFLASHPEQAAVSDSHLQEAASSAEQGVSGREDSTAVRSAVTHAAALRGIGRGSLAVRAAASWGDASSEGGQSAALRGHARRSLAAPVTAPWEPGFSNRTEEQAPVPPLAAAHPSHGLKGWEDAETSRMQDEATRVQAPAARWKPGLPGLTPDQAAAEQPREAGRMLAEASHAQPPPAATKLGHPSPASAAVRAQVAAAPRARRSSAAALQTGGSDDLRSAQSAAPRARRASAHPRTTPWEPPEQALAEPLPAPAPHPRAGSHVEQTVPAADRHLVGGEGDDGETAEWLGFRPGALATPEAAEPWEGGHLGGWGAHKRAGPEASPRHLRPGLVLDSAPPTTGPQKGARGRSASVAVRVRAQSAAPSRRRASVVPQTLHPTLEPPWEAPQRPAVARPASTEAGHGTTPAGTTGDYPIENRDHFFLREEAQNVCSALHAAVPLAEPAAAGAPRAWGGHDGSPDGSAAGPSSVFSGAAHAGLAHSSGFGPNPNPSPSPDVQHQQYPVTGAGGSSTPSSPGAPPARRVRGQAASVVPSRAPDPGRPQQAAQRARRSSAAPRTTPWEPGAGDPGPARAPAPRLVMPGRILGATAEEVVHYREGAEPAQGSCSIHAAGPTGADAACPDAFDAWACVASSQAGRPTEGTCGGGRASGSGSGANIGYAVPCEVPHSGDNRPGHATADRGGLDWDGSSPASALLEDPLLHADLGGDPEEPLDTWRDGWEDTRASLPAVQLQKPDPAPSNAVGSSSDTGSNPAVQLDAAPWAPSATGGPVASLNLGAVAAERFPDARRARARSMLPIGGATRPAAPLLRRASIAAFAPGAGPYLDHVKYDPFIWNLNPDAATGRARASPGVAEPVEEVKSMPAVDASAQPAVPVAASAAAVAARRGRGYARLSLVDSRPVLGAAALAEAAARSHQEGASEGSTGIPRRRPHTAAPGPAHRRPNPAHFPGLHTKAGHRNALDGADEAAVAQRAPGAARRSGSPQQLRRQGPGPGETLVTAAVARADRLSRDVASQVAAPIF